MSSKLVFSHEFASRLQESIRSGLFSGRSHIAKRE